MRKERMDVEEQRWPLKQLENDMATGKANEKRLASPVQKPSSLRKSPRRKKARVAGEEGEEELPREEENENIMSPPPAARRYAKSAEDSPASYGSAPAMEFFEDSSVGTATPPISEVELNTRRNSLRPIQEHSSNMEDATISLDDFQKMLDEAEDDSEDIAQNDGAEEEFDQTMDRDNSPSRDPSEFELNQANLDSPDYNDSRRNTASPSFLRHMLEMSDDDEDEKELISQAAQRGRDLALKLSEPTNKFLSSKSDEDSCRQNEFDSPSLVAQSQRKNFATPSARPTSTNPTPLKSCMRSTKRIQSTKKKSVVFGSPNAAEFNHKEPVLGGVTPLTKTYAKTRFKMEDRSDSDDEDLIEEDNNTKLNSQILSTWDEEIDDEPDSKVDDRMSSSNTSSSSNSKNGSRSSSSSRSKGRRSSSIYQVGKDGMLEPTDDDLDFSGIQEQGADLARKFDAVAMESDDDDDDSDELETEVTKNLRNGRRDSASVDSPFAHNRRYPNISPASSSGETADPRDLLQLGDSPGSRASSRDRDSLSSLPRSPPGDPIDADETIDAKTLSNLMSLSPTEHSSVHTPSTNGRNSDDTIDLDQFPSLANFTPSPLSQGERNTNNEDGAGDETVELGLLSQLASFSADSKKKSKKSKTPLSALRRSPRLRRKSLQNAGLDDDEVDEDSTKELGSLAELVQFSERKKGKSVSMEDSEEEEGNTVELGTLSDLAQLSPSTASGTANAVEARKIENVEENTVPLGSLTELASLQSPIGKTRDATLSKDDEDVTVQLGSLSELAAMSPVQPDEPNRVAFYQDLGESNKKLSNIPETVEEEEEEEEDGDAEDEEDKEQKLALRLSFSSLTSATESGPKTSQKAAFDSAAFLEQFVHSPSGDSEDDESMQNVMEDESSGLKLEGKNTNQLGEASLLERMESEEMVQSNAEQSPKQEISYVFNSQQTRALSPVPTASKEIDEVDDIMELDDQEQQTEVPNKASEIHFEQESVDIPLEDPEVASPPNRDTWEFLSKFNISKPNEIVDSSPEPEMKQVSVSSDALLQDIDISNLSQKCDFIAKLYAEKWAVNEMLSRTKASSQTITNISAALSDKNPALFHLQDCDSIIGAMVEEARIGARIACLDLEAKAVNLSVQAANEHMGIIREDVSVLDMGIKQMDEALQIASQEVEEMNKRFVLTKSINDQRSACSRVQEKISELEEQKVQLETEVEATSSTIAALSIQLEEVRKAASHEKQMEEAEIELQGKSALLDVAYGFHVWRLHQVSSSLVVLAVDHTSGSSDLISIGFSPDSCISSIISHRGTGDEISSGDTEQDESNRTIHKQIENITSQFIHRMTLGLNRTKIGQSSDALPEMLRVVDLDLGRLQNLFEEVLEVTSEGSSGTVSLLNEGNFLLEMELLHMDMGAVVKARFEMTEGYPVEKDSCLVSFQVISEGSSEHLVEFLNQTVAQVLDCPSFTPLSDIWQAIEPAFRS